MLIAAFDGMRPRVSSLAGLSPQAFCTHLKDLGVSRAYFVWNQELGSVQTSHPGLDELAKDLAANTRDFDKHEGIFLSISPRLGALQAAFVHRSCRGQGAGGVRYLPYETMETFLQDGLRLSKGMTLKNALAGLWWGGGKGVIAANSGRAMSDPDMRSQLYEDYGVFLSSLRGCYISAEDAGTTEADMASVFKTTRFTTCIPDGLGGSGNPSEPTALGVVRGMEAILDHLGLGTLTGKTVAIQGLGHVGRAITRFLADRGVGRVVASDLNTDNEAQVRAACPELNLTFLPAKRGENPLLRESVDILSLNATGGGLNEKTIPEISAKIVCGAANNQLQDPTADDLRLRERGILYVPDFLVNRMGIVCCADEASGSIVDDPVIEKHLGCEWDNAIFPLTQRVIKEADQKQTTPHRLALELAEKRSKVLHPLLGHRGQDIINSLVAEGWANS